MPTQSVNDINNKEDNDARRQARETEKQQRLEESKNAREEQIKRNMEKMERDAKLRPTPTVEEVQAALTGNHRDEKEPDGSLEQNPLHPVVGPSGQIEVGRKLSEAKPAGQEGQYRTRAANPSDPKPPQSPPPATPPKKD